MDVEGINTIKKNIVAVGRLLWEKELVSGLNGNISARVDDFQVLLTATKTCLGLLQVKDILLMTLEGDVLEEGEVSSEKLIHTEVYKNFPETQAIIHTHTTYTNAYFLEKDVLLPRIFESKLFLGEVGCITQYTPAVTDAKPVVEALRKNNVMVLRNHGVVSTGKDLFDCFLLVQSLEEAVKIDAISRLYQAGVPQTTEKKKRVAKRTQKAPKKYQLFSDAQIKEIVRLVNEDSQMKELGEKTKMTMDLAVKLDETGRVYSFHFENGRIVDQRNDENTEFLISAPQKIWRAVFNREIDPFVATTQKKMNLKGDFAKISKWYAPCSRIFELWHQVPVE